MNNPPWTRILSIFLLGILLAGHPVSGEMLVCRDGSAPRCCHSVGNPHPSVPRDGTLLLDGAQCTCCVTVDAIPSIASSSPQKSFVNLLSGVAGLQNVIAPPATYLRRPVVAARDHPGLSSLRAVILLI